MAKVITDSHATSPPVPLNPVSSRLTKRGRYKAAVGNIALNHTFPRKSGSVAGDAPSASLGATKVFNLSLLFVSGHLGRLKVMR